MSYLIGGIQQVGIGVRDVDAAWAWYRRRFGMDVPLFREAAPAPLMTRYTGGAVHERDACLAVNLQGGGGLEIWQYTSREPAAPTFGARLGDLGIFATRIRARDVAAASGAFEDARASGSAVPDPAGSSHFFVTDPGGLAFDVVAGEGWFSGGKGPTGGVAGCLIGVSDIDRALRLYRDVLGYDRIAYDSTGVFSDLGALPGGERRVRRVLLAHSAPRRGPFSELLGPSALELVQALDDAPRRIFDGRQWGDLGFIHLCFDVRGMDALREACEAAGHPFTVDSRDSFTMGEAAGRFAYVEDPDGTLIEFVETHRIPILKRLGWSIDLTKRPPERPLPRWMLRAMGLGRMRD